MADKLSVAVSAIRDRIAQVGIQSSPILLHCDDMLNMTVGVDVDMSKVTHGLLEKVHKFNDEAENDITFIKGEIIRRDEISLFVLYFNIGDCSGYIN